MTGVLERILGELATADTCRAYSGIRTGGLNRRCSGVPELVSLVCEHEHFYEAALCREHRQVVAETPLGCPLCRAAADDLHTCRHAVVSS